MPSLLNCSCFLGAVPRLCSLGEILFLCSANLVLQTCTFQLFQLYNCAAKSTFSVLWQRRRRRGGGAGGTNLLFSRDGKLDICAPVSVFTATAGKYAAHFMDTWRCEIGTGRGLPSTGELLKLVPKKGADKVYNQCRSRRVRKVQISTLFEWRIEGYWLQWTLLQSFLGLTFTVVQKFCT